MRQHINLALLTMALGALGLWGYVTAKAIQANQKEPKYLYQVSPSLAVDAVGYEIFKQTFAAGWTYDERQTAYRIAKCESNNDPLARNTQGSSAKGLFQFTDGTWSHYCEGSVFNLRDNVACFVELYPNHPEWWACK